MLVLSILAVLFGIWVGKTNTLILMMLLVALFFFIASVFIVVEIILLLSSRTIQAGRNLFLRNTVYFFLIAMISILVTGHVVFDRRSDLAREYVVAIETYKDVNGHYPEKLSGINASLDTMDCHYSAGKDLQSFTFSYDYNGWEVCNYNSERSSWMCSD